MQLPVSVNPLLKNVVHTAQNWAIHDPNETTSSYVKNLLSEGDEQRTELSNLFPQTGKQRISFGTAGLRSCMKPGPLHMNDLVVIQAAQGIAKYYEEAFSKGNENKCYKGIVIGYDHRANDLLKLSSQSFALFTTLVFKEAGFDDCFLIDSFVATPIIPFAVTYENSFEKNNYIGIMITASHNPKEDAGYKIYWNDGCQIRSPTDAFISESIDNNLIPWTDYGSKLKELKEKNPFEQCCGLSDKGRTSKIIQLYLDAIQKSGLVNFQGLNQSSNMSEYQRPPRFCYTAMHGVGHAFAKRVFTESFGLSTFYSLPAQQEPDPTFPTVLFPNPEERGALDLAKDFAKHENCDIILANDPDADRLAVAEKCRDTGEWTVFTGDQVGVMLGHWLWEKIGKKETSKTIAMFASTVSSKMLAEIAACEGFYFEETLTGFKWIGSRAAELHKIGSYRSLFCYEEAIGYCCGDVVFDKDGLTAMSVFAELSLWVYQQNNNHNLKRHMQSLYDKYGEFVSNNGYYLLKDTEVTFRIFNEVTNNGLFDNLDFVGPYKVKSIRYLGVPGYDSSQVDKMPLLPTSASSPMLTITFNNGCVAQFRGSGTEPKLKYYLELKGEKGIPREVVSRDLQTMSNIILETLLQPTRNGLIIPDVK